MNLNKATQCILLLSLQFAVCNCFIVQPRVTNSRRIGLDSNDPTRKLIPLFRTCQQNSNAHILSTYSSSLKMIPEIQDVSSTIEQSTLILAETEEWRQYVLLFVSLGVILDILLGSPVANLALGPMRRAAMQNDDNENDETSSGSSTSEIKFGSLSDGSGKKDSFMRNPKERIDSEAVGLAALEKARNSMELRRFLEENKTDEQRYEEMRKNIDAEVAKFDSKMEEDK